MKIGRIKKDKKQQKGKVPGGPKSLPPYISCASLSLHWSGSSPPLNRAKEASLKRSNESRRLTIHLLMRGTLFPSRLLKISNIQWRQLTWPVKTTKTPISPPLLHHHLCFFKRPNLSHWFESLLAISHLRAPGRSVLYLGSLLPATFATEEAMGTANARRANRGGGRSQRSETVETRFGRADDAIPGRLG